MEKRCMKCNKIITPELTPRRWKYCSAYCAAHDGYGRWKRRNAYWIERRAQRRKDEAEGKLKPLTPPTKEEIREAELEWEQMQREETYMEQFVQSRISAPKKLTSTKEVSMPEINTNDYMGFVAIDTVTGFKGTVTSIAFYLVGSAQVELTNGKCDSKWFDIGRIAVSKSVMRQRIVDADTGESEWYHLNDGAKKKGGVSA